MVEASIERVQATGQSDTYVAAYEFHDDSPPPPSLEEKKQARYGELLKAEHAAKAKVMPQRKIRLVAMTHNEAIAVPEVERTLEHGEAIVTYQEVAAAFKKIELAAAKAESDIEDLTEENIDSWKVPDLDG
jgi:hypothetical protein